MIIVNVGPWCTYSFILIHVIVNDMSKVIGVIGFKSEIVMQVFKSEIVMEEPKSRKDGNIVYRESECL